MRFLAWLSTAFPLLLRCSGGPCAKVYEVRFTGATGIPGRYQVDVVNDGVPSTCEITLPLSCYADQTCSRSDQSWELRVSRCTLDGGGETIIEGFYIRDQPTMLELVVRRDGVVVGEGKVRPGYYESNPPGGNQKCRIAPPFMLEIQP